MASLNTNRIMASFSTVPVAGMAGLNTNEIVVAWLASEQHHATTDSTSLNTDAQREPRRLCSWHGKFLSSTWRWHSHSQVLSIVVNADSFSKAPAAYLAKAKRVANVDSFLTAPVAGMASYHITLAARDQN